MNRYDHKGVSHYEFLERLHRWLNPRTYLEIGTLKGGTLRLASCPTICIDPEFQLDVSSAANREVTLFYQKTSDRFFQDHSPSALLNGPVDLGFLDGLHEAETLLRDFANLEKHCRSNSVIAIHDCIPMDVGQTTRINNGGLWTGDVWKVVPILKEYRPDISIFVFDAHPTGLVCCTNLDHGNTILDGMYGEIWRTWRSTELSDYGFSRLIEEANIISTSRVETPEEMRRYFWL
ncbi:class I SAM-dependent methyltransferase [Methylobacterium nodulans]|uniref:Class I SAM-dependent methyltransferase n=1 Tax=Methylobacterium nodulans (strain LMG 21967 / CNCM I-2342 / ORS 2060) TaxID=460265 RepID=B8IAE3_METNO|nr:class I SAM-dependent methyltransferase [Methylobacterium nodulans]ACL59206.1 conserved hypothetical protein [Methylobacterium nodulans ORS 2060]